jgi:O-antigen ligase
MTATAHRVAFPAAVLALAAVVGLASAISPAAVAALAVVLGVGFGLVRQPLLGLAALLSTLVFGQVLRFGFSGGTANILPTDLLLPAVLGAWLVSSVIFGRIPVVRSRLLAPTGAWLLAVALSLATGLPRLNLDAQDSLVAALYAARWVLYFGAFLLTADAVRSERQARAVVFGLIAIGLLVAGFGFIQLAVFPDFSSMVPKGWDPHVGRLLSTWFDPNFVGGFFAFLLLVALAVAWESRGAARLALLAAVAVLLAALLLTYSRSAYAALLVGGALFAVLRARVLLVAGALVGIIVFAAVPRIQERVIGVRSVDETAQLRIVSWQNALEVLRDHPLTGVGYNAYRFAQVKYGFLTDAADHSAGGSDSSLLTVAVTTGVVGFTAYVWLIGAQFVTAWSGVQSSGFRRGLSTGVVCGLVALLAHGQFINGLLFPHLMLTTWVSLGVLTSLERTHT